jgi:recombinational DNA repair ATPase RecF
MFGYLISALCNDGKILTDKDIVLYGSSNTKICVGCNAQGRQQLLAAINTLTEFGLSVKDEATNELLTDEDVDSDAGSVQSEWGSVETCMIMGVPPFLK